MALIEWSETYRSGHSRIDAQHRNLFDLLNRLHDRIMAGSGGAGVEETLNELTEYVQEHFRDEESLMIEAGYPATHEHRDLHEKLVGKVDEFRRSRNTSNPITPLDLVRFLSAWIQYHILLEDLKLVRWLEKQN